jgi:hypothetical protein
MDDGLMTGLTSITLTVIAHGTGVIDYGGLAWSHASQISLHLRDRA